jgi:hypothetical protein
VVVVTVVAVAGVMVLLLEDTVLVVLAVVRVAVSLPEVSEFVRLLETEVPVVSVLVTRAMTSCCTKVQASVPGPDAAWMTSIGLWQA